MILNSQVFDLSPDFSRLLNEKVKIYGNFNYIFEKSLRDGYVN